MPVPRVFISSTCYDLKYIRESLKFFIRTLGYEPILSEEGSVFYNPSMHTQDACLAEVPACQMFILIIGGRFGSQHKKTDKSITNAEYQEAVRANIPIFALVEREVYEQYKVYISNKKNLDIDYKKISYSAVDSPRIFDFIDKVRGQAINNALFPFHSFEEMQNYLKQQRAGLMYSFLMSESSAKKVSDILSYLSETTGKVEFLTRILVDSVAGPIAKVAVELSDIVSQNSSLRIFGSLRVDPTPEDILKHSDLDRFLGYYFMVLRKNDSIEISSGKATLTFSSNLFEKFREDYLVVREKLIKHLKDKGIMVEEYLERKVANQ